MEFEGERWLIAGILSKESSFRIMVQGPIGPIEIDALIRKLELDKELLQRSEPLKIIGSIKPLVKAEPSKDLVTLNGSSAKIISKGINPDTGREKRIIPDNLAKEFIEAWKAKKLTHRQLAAIIDCSLSSVSYYIKKFNYLLDERDREVPTEEVPFVEKKELLNPILRNYPQPELRKKETVVPSKLAETGERSTLPIIQLPADLQEGLSYFKSRIQKN